MKPDMTTSTFPSNERRLVVLGTAAALLSLLATASIIFIFTSGSGSGLPDPFSTWTVGPPLVEEITPPDPEVPLAAAAPVAGAAQAAARPAPAIVAGASLAPAAGSGDSVSSDHYEGNVSGEDEAVVAGRGSREEEDHRERGDD